MQIARRFIVAVAATAVTAALAVAPAASHAEREAKVVSDYTVFVDPPTGFVFVKLPAGWKFAGRVDAAAVARLPDGVVTALLTGDADADAPTRVAMRATP